MREIGVQTEPETRTVDAQTIVSIPLEREIEERVQLNLEAEHAPEQMMRSRPVPEQTPEPIETLPIGVVVNIDDGMSSFDSDETGPTRTEQELGSLDWSFFNESAFGTPHPAIAPDFQLNDAGAFVALNPSMVQGEELPQPVPPSPSPQLIVASLQQQRPTATRSHVDRVFGNRAHEEGLESSRRNVQPSDALYTDYVTASRHTEEGQRR